MFYIKIGGELLSSYRFAERIEPRAAYAVFVKEAGDALSAEGRAAELIWEMGARRLTRKFRRQDDTEELYRELRVASETSPGRIALVTPFRAEWPEPPGTLSEDELAEYLFALRAQLTGYASGSSFAPMKQERLCGLPLEVVERIAEGAGFIVCEASMGKVPCDVVGSTTAQRSLPERCGSARNRDDFLCLVRELDGREGENDCEEVLACAEALKGSLERARAKDTADYREILSVCIPGPNAGVNPNPYLSELYLAALKALADLEQGGFIRVYDDVGRAIIEMEGGIEFLSDQYFRPEDGRVDGGILHLTSALLRFREALADTDPNGDGSLEHFKSKFEKRFGERSMDSAKSLMVALVSSPCIGWEESIMRIRTITMLGRLLGFDRLAEDN